jgi:hypothetical protein
MLSINESMLALKIQQGYRGKNANFGNWDKILKYFIRPLKNEGEHHVSRMMRNNKDYRETMQGFYALLHSRESGFKKSDI